ncbi:MAG: sigma-70 family RNA polymerase sigma factor [Bacteroidota bacterium]
MNRHSTTQEHTYVLERIKEGDEGFLKALYFENRLAFISCMMRKVACHEEIARELYQKSFTIFYYKIIDGDLSHLFCKPLTFLVAIGKNLYRDEIKKKDAQALDIHVEAAQHSYTPECEARMEEQDRKHMVRRIFHRMDDSCREILQLFYFQKFSMESIANQLGYSSDTVARKKKSICLKKIRKVLNTTSVLNNTY